MYCVSNVLKDKFKTDLVLQTLFLPKTEAIKVFDRFLRTMLPRNYCIIFIVWLCCT